MLGLSPNNKFLKSSFFIFISITGFFIWLLIYDVLDFWQRLIGLLLICAGFATANNIYRKSDNVYYDYRYLYLVNGDEIRKLELEKIIRIKLNLGGMNILGIRFQKFMIELFNERGERESITFFVTLGSFKNQEFQEHLKKHFPKAKIENWANSFSN